MRKIEDCLSKFKKMLYRHKHDFHFIRKLEYKVIKQFLDPHKEEVVLDLACGNGYYSQKLAHCGCYVKGLDGDKERIRYANYYHKVNGCQFEVGDAENIPYGSATFDKVFIICAFQFFNSPDKAIIEINRVLKKNGKLVLSVDHFSDNKVKNEFKEWHREKYSVVNYFGFSDLKVLLETLGFTLIESKYILTSNISYIFYEWALKRGCTGLSFLLSFPVAYLSILISDRLSKRKDEGYILIVSAEKKN
jgi:ubiquinone/menaquinone biosynthesis C-methylase UbiE